MSESAPRVAVVGLGVLGLVTVKNLVEEGFNVTGFERNGFVGGLWHYADDNRTSVLSSTLINISKERGCFTDFPFPDSVPSHASAADVRRYLEDYVQHFGLGPHLRLDTAVTKVRRDDQQDRWVLYIENSAAEFFDKVIIATGINSLPHVPQLRGVDLFTGPCIHSQAFKRPEEFKDRKVLVVGLGNTGADTAVALVGHAHKVYLSHNHGAIVVPRIVKGRPMDHTLTARIVAFQGLMERYVPWLGERVVNAMLRKMQNNAFRIRPEWKLSPAPSIRHAVPIVSDTLISAFESGDVQSVAGVAQVTGPNEVELDDGSRPEVDCIIWCTGYRTDFSVLDHAVDPTRHTTPRWTAARGSRGKPLPRLYQNVFSLDYPESLAFMGCVAFPTGAFPLYDIASMAVAQVWKGRSPLPPRGEMERAVDRQHGWLCDVAESGSAIPGWVRQYEWMAWAHRAAGTGVDEYLGWGWKGWKFWLTNRSFCSLLLGGIYTPYLFRVFETGKRKAWEGARAEIEKVNRAVRDRKRD
ncbi:FAD/NAD(P)-binding domain-containing protein [Auricularia subglabra TFB-10046 SS5]|nr:FAD/NAD(P)-binding domain-containing protein [Auricularia subglabra TFB-10046 SS5]